MASTIEVKNIGPVEELSLPVPENGGLVVLRGRNGSGKTQTLRAVEAAVTGKGRPSVRDGALRGEVSACGVTMKVGRTTRRSGELVVETLDGKLNVADLVDPGIKSADAADARRIKALISLSGAKPDPSLFESLFSSSEEFRAVVSASTLETDDVVLLAERIKRDCESAARKEESLSEHAAGEAKGARASAEGVSLGVETDPGVLQQRLEEAITRHSELAARRDEAAKYETQRSEAMRAFRALEEAYDGQSVEWHREAVNIAENVVDVETERVRELERQLADARAKLELACTEKAAAIRALKAAEQHHEMKRQYVEIINRDAPKGPSDDEIAAAEAAVTEARQAVESGAIARRAAAAIQTADELDQQAARHIRRAARLREAAKGTDEVLSELVSATGSPLRVEAGRLVLTTHRGDTYFADLSHGERWKLALDIAIEAVGERGLLVVDQEAWEGLDPVNRAEIAEHVKGRGVVVLTAEATDDDEITAEVV